MLRSGNWPIRFRKAPVYSVFPPEVLSDGSLYIPYGLEVHPSVRGQNLGLMLLAFAVRNLVTCKGDLMMGIAEPFTGRLAEGEADFGGRPESVDELGAYFECAGFGSLASGGDIGPTNTEGIV